MQLIRELLGAKRRSSALATIPDRDAYRQQTRRELLGMAVRDTLRRNGIPERWISAETYVSRTRAGEQGIHLRLVLHEWEPRVVAFAIPLQRAVAARLQRLDPLAGAWLAGVSWHFAVADTAACPDLPPLAHWAAGSVRSGPPGQSASPWSREMAADFRPTQPMARA